MTLRAPSSTLNNNRFGPVTSAAFYAAHPTAFRVFRVFRGYFSIVNCQLSIVNS
jgi:hypothetical protein